MLTHEAGAIHDKTPPFIKDIESPQGDNLASNNKFHSETTVSYIASFKNCTSNKIILQMYTRIQTPKQSEGYLARRFNVEAFEKEREEYYSLIQKLNLQNKELNQDYKKLLEENMALKRIVKNQDGHKDGKTTVNYQEDRRKVMRTQQADTFDDRRQRQITPNQRIKPNLQDEIKTRNAPRQRHDNFDQTKLKKPTIIEDLSQSHFNRKSNSNQISRTPNTNRDNKPRNIQSSSKAIEHPREKDTAGQLKRNLKEINFHESRETIELVTKEDDSNRYEYSETYEVKAVERKPSSKYKEDINPQKYETSRSKQDNEYKKDNTPYRTLSSNGAYVNVGPPLKKTYHDYLPKNSSALKRSNQRYCSNC